MTQIKEFLFLENLIHIVMFSDRKKFICFFLQNLNFLLYFNKDNNIYSKNLFVY